ncbi:hypothetical protein CCFV1_ORF091 [Cotesia congregata filamentous virus 1]|uniref:Uncharacterized protein n=1 Tax=Cotesia congregata filamentous virus 1 TaxID=3064291 RepID=A0ABC8QJR5_9VIRU|nr:hypothetical protein CCFV1_ORF091 [Cotesia congregata filamentous virus 1]
MNKAEVKAVLKYLCLIKKINIRDAHLELTQYFESRSLPYSTVARWVKLLKNDSLSQKQMFYPLVKKKKCVPHQCGASCDHEAQIEFDEVDDE